MVGVGVTSGRLRWCLLRLPNLYLNHFVSDIFSGEYFTVRGALNFDAIIDRLQPDKAHSQQKITAIFN
jgi:hypothetical protein